MAEPAIRIVRGNPDDVEVAALVAVLSALGAGTPRSAPPGSPVPKPRKPVRFVPATSWRMAR
ncbi:hypothetical protein GCM10022222_35050 [Amycolatopsis ultiminotia]|uniref:Acyl-CoA carboxylase epsilon subunit n=1 Tax=Amycolatopsis ultiminotia TaxID=543629 RepID=A0ABP6W901_9PSEU